MNNELHFSFVPRPKKEDKDNASSSSRVDKILFFFCGVAVGVALCVVAAVIIAEFF